MNNPSGARVHAHSYGGDDSTRGAANDAAAKIDRLAHSSDVYLNLVLSMLSVLFSRLLLVRSSRGSAAHGGTDITQSMLGTAARTIPVRLRVRVGAVNPAPVDHVSLKIYIFAAFSEIL